MWDYTPNERIVDKAVELWISMLSDPKYDNLGKNSQESFESRVQNTMASVLAKKLQKNNTPEVLARFGMELKKFLMEPTEYTYTSYDKVVKTEKQLFRYLSVDYHPDTPLRIAAELAGLNMEFPWKTSMYLDENFVSVVYGYGDARTYYYPLSNDGWLTTTLNGEDISKIIKLVEDGYLDNSLAPLNK